MNWQPRPVARIVVAPQALPAEVEDWCVSHLGAVTTKLPRHAIRFEIVETKPRRFRPRWAPEAAGRESALSSLALYIWMVDLEEWKRACLQTAE